MTFEAMPFDLAVGLPGGVAAGAPQNSRNAYLEQAVRDQQTSNTFYQQKVADLTPVQTYFDLSSTSGIAPSMSTLFNDFSQLSVNPNDSVLRQTVLNDAATVAENFNSAASGLASQATEIQQQTSGAIQNINELAGQIAGINSQAQVDQAGGTDAGVDAQLNSSLEQLSQLVNFTVLQQPDGTVSVYLGGQTPLVIGNQTYAVQGDFTTPQIAIDSNTGTDITSQLTGGQLGALLDDKNNLLPSYITGLNTLAQSFADQVNSALDNGIDQNGAAPPTDLFSYNAAVGAAQSLAVNPLTPDQIAAASPGAPGGNGNALVLANLANQPTVDGATFSQYYGTLGEQVGSGLSTAQANQSTSQSLLNQAQAQREQVSGVSIDEEAESLLQYQRSYQALSKMLGVLNSVTDTLMNMMGVVTT